MPDPDLLKPDDGIVWKAMGGLAAFAGAVLSFLFHRVIQKHDQEISGLHSAIAAKADNDDLHEHMKRSEKARDELRESQKLLFTKMDNMRDHVDAKFDKLADLIRAQK